MAGTRRQDRLALQGLHAYTWVVAATLVLVVVCAVLQVGLVRPYLYPAGAGAIVSGEAAGRLPLIARPPDVSDDGAAGTVIAVADRSPAADAAIAPGHQVLSQVTDGPAVDFSRVRNAAPPERLGVWRDSYRLGVRGPAWWQLESGGGTRRVLLNRPAAWRTPLLKDWAALHAGMIIQIIVFTGGALLLFALRSNDLTAALSVLALALSAIGGGGPLLGAEHSIPIAGRVLTVFAWMASPLAFPVIALAILYFPSRSPLLVRFPLLHVVPFVVAGPMLVLGGATALYLTGVEGARNLAAWDAAHPAAYYGSFAAALGVNLLAIAEGVYRYRFNHDANERRRIRMAVYTAVPGVIAYALKDGVPIVSRLAGFEAPVYSVSVAAVLQGLVLLPAFGLVYAVGVERVLGPRVVLRRSLQYALASQTLTALAVLPAAALVVSLVRNRQMSIAEAAASGSGLYVALIALSVGAFAFRERARLWLDQRFFREEYDGRKILISLASRVRFETDPADLASLVVRQIDEALHPETTAILVSGVDEGVMTPVTVLHGTADALPLDGGLVSMLRWSEEPLEIFIHDPRSPAHRLPPDEQAWLECTGATLLVPVLGQERALIGLIALGEKRSEEAYTKEDRELLASIAGQMGLGFDVARLQLRSGREGGTANGTTRVLAPLAQPVAECVRCGRCEDGGTTVCPGDGAPMQQVPSVPRIVDNKYRLEQLLGRGGMGAVYRARDVRLDRLVALKVVKPELLDDLEARRRFRREAQIVARLQHPSIVAVFDYGTFPDGGAYLVMELVRGEDLRRVLQREGRLESDRALPILTSVCHAIEAAHREGVLHRDLKPENILLPGGQLEAKVLDFGVAKVMSDERAGRGAADSRDDGMTVLTAAGMIVGTPAYMAPEQFRAVAADARTDIFSLGVVAYEMLSGELPFGRGSLAEVVLAQARGVKAMQPGLVSPALERAVRSALEADPDRRPASAQAFAHLLGAAADL